MTTLQYPQYALVASPAGPVLALAWTPQANFASATTPQNQIQYHNPNPNANSPIDLAHLLARASYVNNKDQTKDIYSWILDSGVSQHFANDVQDLKYYKRFLKSREVYLGDNTVFYAEGQGTQLLQIGPDLSVWFVPDLVEKPLIHTSPRPGGIFLLTRKRYCSNSETWLAKFEMAQAGRCPLWWPLSVHINRKSMIDSPRALTTHWQRV